MNKVSRKLPVIGGDPFYSTLVVQKIEDVFRSGGVTAKEHLEDGDVEQPSVFGVMNSEARGMSVTAPDREDYLGLRYLQD